ncbi:MAG: nitroreductase/quinone reductase family protein [Myxococcota bacterium]
MPNIRWLLAVITAVHRFLYRASGGWVGHGALGFRFLLLGCTGHKTGLERQIPLLYVADGDRFVVVASNSGDALPPAWWTNLRAKPEAWVQVGRERSDVVAREATPEEAERLWPRMVEAYRWYDDYRERAGRPIALVLLEPASR